ncbi:MAG TPA: bifunctional hydroxymethylpyrimidine kinase/phosphomethylpyrimidine kinase [Candidatus Paceibacterota bacterium]|nr:bifunctional hydroxymethylpyrimidine kinase/phosphomethylpyrimidine kinase [Verrucomicrobiota bacterium]HSA12443.1 bifunctional hydroxymethylpyrimidine kinase/phosphomethylpyrimidine kinase [Candidatus Paceibacterota bacterium]
MSKRPTLPVALTIAGSDSGGGAGIQADLKTFAAIGVHGTSAITCITAQNPKGVYGIQACNVNIVRGQMEAVFEALRPASIKTGMLYSAPIIRAVTVALKRCQRVPLVVDPVMVSTSGAQLLKPDAVRALCAKLLPLATLVTPNLDEAGILVGTKLGSVTDLRAAARTLYQQFGCATLVKGGHLPGLRQAVDIFYDGRQELLLSAPFIRSVSTHGTGCTYSAAIAGHLARGCSLANAVQRAKEFITQAIARSQTAAGQGVLNCFWR